MKLERNIQWEVREALGRDPRVVLWRNNCGEYRARTGGVVRYGIANPGGSDLIGILRPSGRWFCLELKSETGRATGDQKLFIELVRAAGGFAAVVRSADEARAALERALAGASE